jgi:NAD(P) transhydrogenase subunit alpha
MKILVLKENNNDEKRVAITPDLIAKYNKIGYEVLVESDAGKKSGIDNELYEKSGAKIVTDVSKSISEADIILKVAAPEEAQLSGVKQNALLLGMLDPYDSSAQINSYAKLGISAIACELFPRITRAQSMDVLSSQSNLAGYRAVIDAVYELNSAVPMMMTAAGTITPAKIMIIGAGVAGLQAIATAKRLGAVVVAFDVRAVAKEQVESLGAKFIEVKNDDGDAQTKGGYAKEMSEEYKKRQQQALHDNIINQNIVITTALIPGKPAPKLITEEMVKNMKVGSIIIDLAAKMGGNCALTEPGKIIEKYGVKIIGHNNIASRIASDASKLYAKNLFNFIEFFTDKDKKEMVINLEDEIIKSSLLTHNGQVLFK